MAEKPTPRDPHPDNDLIDAIVSEAGAQSGGREQRTVAEVLSREELKSATGGDPGRTGVHKNDKAQPRKATRSDHEGSAS